MAQIPPPRRAPAASEAPRERGGMLLGLPRSSGEIEAIQSRRKRRAVEQARRVPFYAGKLDHVNLSKLDDPAEWRKIPILEKDMLRALSDQEFYGTFCLTPDDGLAEYWRSGGPTGPPLFYPGRFTDIDAAMVGFARIFDCTGCARGARAHVSFPLGIHPVGHMVARSAIAAGITVNWAGSGTTTPSHMQLDLIARPKHARHWGARVHATFGMTEDGMMGAEDEAGRGFRIWTDMFLIEVLDPQTLAPVGEGEAGTLVVTPLWTNNVTPFLRWSPGDLVTWRRGREDGRPYSVFPRVKHAHRTTGFFKVRGISLNHADMEDFMFTNAAIGDFKAEVVSKRGLDVLVLSIEVRRGADSAAVAAELRQSVKDRFELTPEVAVLETGTLAKEFEASVKSPRFVDRRQ